MYHDPTGLFFTSIVSGIANVASTIASAIVGAAAAYSAGKSVYESYSSSSDSSSSSNDSGTNDINNIWDSHTINRIAPLHPDIQVSVISFILDAQSQGFNLRITADGGYRSIAEQDALWQRGRNEHGNVIGQTVTNVRGGASYHNYGLAIDVVEIRDNQALWANPNWDLIGEIGEFHGFEWGGRWTNFPDRPHFQMTFGLTTNQLLEMYRAGNTTGGFVNLR